MNEITGIKFQIIYWCGNNPLEVLCIKSFWEVSSDNGTTLIKRCYYFHNIIKERISMTPQEKEIEKMRESIKIELRLIFKANMKIFDWDIPENDDRKSAELIVQTMQEALDEVKQEINDGKYDNY